MTTKVLIVIAAALLIFGIVMVILYFRKKCNPDKTCIDAVAFSNQMNTLKAIGLGTAAKTGVNGGIAVLDVGAANAAQKVPGPLYLPDGLKLWMDTGIPDRPKIEPTDDQNIYLQWDRFTTRLGVICNDSLNGWKDGTYVDLALVTDFRQGANHFANLLDGYLAKNDRNASLIWNEVNAMFIFLNSLPIYTPPTGSDKPVLPPTLTIPVKLPDIDQVYGWIKQELSNIGGISGIIKKFETRIKYDMIQNLINNETTNGQPYRIIPSDAAATGSGHCTAYPLSWWQNCPNGSIPSGSQGWGKDKDKYACNKWYQHISGELMCKTYTQNDATRLGGFCDTITAAAGDPEFETKLVKMKAFVSESLSRILADLGLIPALSGVIRVVTQIFSIAGNFEWIYDDLKDVCYNYRCVEDKNKDTYACGGGTTNSTKKCCPMDSDSVLATRSCPGLDCNNEARGKCTAVNDPCNTTISLKATADVIARDLYRERTTPQRR